MGSASPVRVQGRFTPPGDKSIGHRLALLSALAEGRSTISGFPTARDCARSVALVEALGVGVTREGATLEIQGRGPEALEAPRSELDAGNSGSTARMACGLLAPRPFESRIAGDESLSRRPFGRVVRPLEDMGAAIETTAGGLPLVVRCGRPLHAIDYTLPVPSAQVKTAVLLAGLFAEGTTWIRETLPTRDHTEIALTAFGGDLLTSSGAIGVRGGSSRLRGGRFDVPGDFSSAAFFITAAAFLPGSELVVEGVGLNPTRTGLLDVLLGMGADIELEPEPVSRGEEPRGRLRVRGAPLHGVAVPPEKLPTMIDEIPVLAVAAAFAEGPTRIEGASELRVKESNRLDAIIEGLGALGAPVERLEDGFVVHGGRPLAPARLRSFGDHRMVMAWAIASLGLDGGCRIDHLDQVKISYPGFWETLDRLVR